MIQYPNAGLPAMTAVMFAVSVVLSIVSAIFLLRDRREDDVVAARLATGFVAWAVINGVVAFYLANQ